MEVEGSNGRTKRKSGSAAKEHKEQLEKLKEKDPEFYEFLQGHDKELLEFQDADFGDDVDDDNEEDETQADDETGELENVEKEQKPFQKIITNEMVDSWCNSVQMDPKLSAIRSLMRAFRTACHYGDDTGDDPATKFSTMSSSVFNNIMIFVLSKMDGILRSLLKLPSFGGRRENINELTSTKQWKNYSHLLKSYLANSLHVLNQMTDTEMISFTLRRLQYSSLFLAAFPSLLRKYIKVVLHFWGTGNGALPVVSFLFLRDICIRIEADCLDECFRGIYKTYILNCHYVNAVKLPHIQFLGNCVIELYRVDLPTAYQHAFVFIRQLAMLLRDALTLKRKEAYQKVYEWKFINCLELWTGAVCAFGPESDFRHLSYPLTQIISGVARLVPTARYFPLRLRCVRMLNRISASTGTFIPVSMILLDMLEMRELNRPPTGGVGNAVNLLTALKVSKPTLKTRAFQEACVISVVEQLAEHLAQWSYSVAFFELSFIPAARLRTFCKTTKVERFRKEMRQLIRQINANSEFTNERRKSIDFLPNDPAAMSFLEDEKKLGKSPLSKYVATLRKRAQQRTDSLVESSVLVGEKSSAFGSKINRLSADDEENDIGEEEGAAVFSSSWLPGSASKAKRAKDDTEEDDADKKKKKKKKNKKMKMTEGEEFAMDEGDDVVEDLVLSSDEDGSFSDYPSAEEDDAAKRSAFRQQGKNKKHTNLSKKNTKFRAKMSRKRKRAS